MARSAIVTVFGPPLIVSSSVAIRNIRKSGL